MELTLDQAREIARLRRRWPDGEVVLHHRADDLILEIRRDRRTVAVERFAGDGTVGGPPAVALAA